jgi:hypothetical protein
MGLFYPYCLNPQLIGYANAGYLFDPHKGRSQTGYLFTYGNTGISWRSVKQTISATSSNHSEIIAIHEASRECVWLRSVIQHIQEKCGLSSIKGSPTILYEDNAELEEEISKVIELNTFHQNSFIHMSSRRAVILMSSRYTQVTIWLTYSLSCYRLQHSRRSYTTLACVDLKIYIFMRGSK